jgi:hypothetical protein
MALKWLAVMQNGLGEFQAARKALGEALSMLQLRDLDYAGVLLMAAKINIAEGLWRKAQTNLEEAKQLFKSAPRLNKHEQMEYAVLLNDMGICHKHLQQWSDALACYREASEYVRTLHGSAHPEYAAALRNLALLYQNLTMYGEATARLEEALVIRRKVFGDQHPLTMEVASNLEEARRIAHPEQRDRRPRSLASWWEMLSPIFFWLVAAGLGISFGWKFVAGRCRRPQVIPTRFDFRCVLKIVSQKKSSVPLALRKNSSQSSGAKSPRSNAAVDVEQGLWLHRRKGSQAVDASMEERGKDAEDPLWGRRKASQVDLERGKPHINAAVDVEDLWLHRRKGSQAVDASMEDRGKDAEDPLWGRRKGSQVDLERGNELGVPRAGQSGPYVCAACGVTALEMSKCSVSPASYQDQSA